MAAGSPNRDGYSLAQAVHDVFGVDRAWLSWIMVVAAGLLGGVASPLLTTAADGAGTWAARFTCAAVGVVVGGVLTLLPRVVSLLMLGAALRTRPADLGGVERPWWPLRLLAAALANTPPARRTNQDFADAVDGIVTPVRGLLGRRSWPACAAAFTAPALGLLAAWQAWQAFIDGPRFQELLRAARDREQVLPVPGIFEQASFPMVVSIVSALLLMLAVVGIDQWSRKTVQSWATTVQPSDADAAFVGGVLGDGISVGVPSGPSPPVVKGPVTMPPGPDRSPPPPVVTPISSEELDKLGDLFKDG